MEEWNRIMSIQITVEQGQRAPRHCALKSDQVATLGRHANNTIVLNDAHASRWHALIHSEGGRWFISPVGNPVNGTRVHGEAVTGQTELLDGHEILIGDTRLRAALERQAGGAASDPASTLLCPDELATMVSFLSRAVNATEHQGLIRLSLETVAHQTQASVTGYLSLEDEPQARVIYPEQEQVDVPLSGQLTRQALQSGRSVRAGGAVPASLPESLRGFSDALCVPVPATGDGVAECNFVGAIHLYRVGAHSASVTSGLAKWSPGRWPATWPRCGPAAVCRRRTPA
jgi:predicted component of type VI protein secretion system